MLREARLAARLDHPNIVRIYDVAEHDDRPWIVMQLVPYRSLHDIVRESGPLSPRQAASIGLRILAAITAAHAAGILHRDVKPGNVLLGPDEHVVLTDFGLAIADGSTRVTTSGLVLGSPAYMSPERAHGQRATLASDLWSLGATLYAAVEGRDAFDRNGALAVLTAIATDEPDRPVRAGPLWPVISELLRKDPAARPSADQVEQDSRGIAGDPEVGRTALPAYLTVPLSTAELAAGTLPSVHVADREGDTPGLPAAGVAVAAAAAYDDADSLSRTPPRPRSASPASASPPPLIPACPRRPGGPPARPRPAGRLAHRRRSVAAPRPAGRGRRPRAARPSRPLPSGWPTPHRASPGQIWPAGGPRPPIRGYNAASDFACGGPDDAAAQRVTVSVSRHQPGNRSG